MNTLCSSLRYHKATRHIQILAAILIIFAGACSIGYAQNTGLNRETVSLDALPDAIGNDDLAVLKKYLRSGGDPNGLIKGERLLSIATHKNGMAHLECMQLLLQSHANPNLPNNDGYFPLEIATDARHALDSAFDLLLRSGANVNQQDSNGDTVLMEAALVSPTYWEMGIDFMKKAIAKGANINARDKLGLSALDYSEENGMTIVSHFLLSHGAISLRPRGSSISAMQVFVNAIRNKDSKTLLGLISKTGVTEVNTLVADNEPDVMKRLNSRKSYPYGELARDAANVSGEVYHTFLLRRADTSEGDSCFSDCILSVPLSRWHVSSDNNFSAHVQDGHKFHPIVYVKWKAQAGHWVVDEFGYPQGLY